ncbi:MAG: ankyrin repeat protein [Lentimonas sp.]
MSFLFKKKYTKNTLQSKGLSRFKKAFFFCIFSSFLIASALFSEKIKAQIDNIIIEDNDGIIGITSLMNAVVNEDLRAVEFFSRYGSEVIDQQNIGGAAALHLAARGNNIQIAKNLIKGGANVNISDNEGWTPLMRAALSNNSDLIKILLKKSADPRKMNSMGETAIIHSSSAECLSCLNEIFSSYDFINKLNKKDLRDQIKRALTISENKNNEEVKNFLNQYLARINKVQTQNSYKLIQPESPKDFKSESLPIDKDLKKENEVLIVRSLNVKDLEEANNSISEIYDAVGTKNVAIKYVFLGRSRKFVENQVKFVEENLKKEAPKNDSEDKLPFKKSRSSSKTLKKYIFKGQKKPFVPFKVKNPNDKFDKKIVEEVNEIKSSSDLIEIKPMKGRGVVRKNVKYNFGGSSKPSPLK